MKKFLSDAAGRIRRFRGKLVLETFGFSFPPFAAYFKVKHRRDKTSISTKVIKSATVQTSVSPLGILWDTVDTMADAERKRAMKRRDWETAIVASLVQSYIRAQRGDTGGGRA
jgi:hypothetical protein